MTDLVKPSVVIVTATDYVTVTPTSIAAIQSSTPSASSSHMSSSSPSISTAHVSTSTLTASYTITPNLPSDFAKPVNPKPKFNDTLAILALVAVILMGILPVALIGYMIYLRCKGECPKCKNLKAQVGKWERGELKRITKDMVQRRCEIPNDSSSSRFVADLEKGTLDACQDDVVAQHARATALAQLEGKKKPLPPIQIQDGAIDGDRFFTVQVDSPAPHHQEPTLQPTRTHYEPGDNRLYDLPSPSAFSPPTEIKGPRTFDDHTESDILKHTEFPLAGESGDVFSEAQDDMHGSYRLPNWRQIQREDGFF
ncbi:Nn.00g029590.m01.CDS01 [Neocucurbitaria sp. VM-36]